MEHTNSVKTPLNPKQTIEPNSEGNKGNKSNAYARLIRSLQYLTTATHPDIVFTVNRLSAFTANPSMLHQTAAKHILRYLSGTKNLGITYRKMTAHENDNLFHGYHKSLYSNSLLKVKPVYVPSQARIRISQSMVYSTQLTIVPRIRISMIC